MPKQSPPQTQKSDQEANNMPMTRIPKQKTHYRTPQGTAPSTPTRAYHYYYHYYNHPPTPEPWQQPTTSNGKNVPVFNAFLPSQCAWIFNWLFMTAFPTLTRSISNIEISIDNSNFEFEFRKAICLPYNTHL
jgi:hypothetical protein